MFKTTLHRPKQWTCIWFYLNNGNLDGENADNAIVEERQDFDVTNILEVGFSVTLI